MQQQTLTKTYLLLLLVPLFWGGAFGTTKHVLTELPPLTISAVRFALAGLILIGWMILRKEWHWRLVKSNFASLLGLGLSGVFFYNYFFASALQYTSAIKAALIIVVNPVFTACAAILFFGETWNWRIGFGVLLSLVGVFFVITQGDFLLLTSQPWGLGELYCLGAVASWVIYTLIAKKLMREMSTTLMTTASTVLGSFVLILAAGFTENRWSRLLSLSTQTTMEMFYLAIFPTVIAFILYNWGIQRIGATKTSAYINLMPINALWIAVLFYGETVTVHHLLGMALTLSGVIITTQAKGQTAIAESHSQSS